MSVSKGLQKSIKSFSVLGKKNGGQVLFKTPHLKLIARPRYMEVACQDEDLLEREEFISFLRHTRKFFEEGFKNKILVTLSKDWDVNIDAWLAIVKLEFRQIHFMKIAFVAMNMHQRLLFRPLQQLHFNVRVFQQKSDAIAWLDQDLLTE